MSLYVIQSNVIRKSYSFRVLTNYMITFLLSLINRLYFEWFGKVPYHSSMHVRHYKSTSCATCIKKKGVFFDRRRRTSLLHQQKQQVAVCLERYLEKLWCKDTESVIGVGVCACLMFNLDTYVYGWNWDTYTYVSCNAAWIKIDSKLEC